MSSIPPIHLGIRIFRYLNADLPIWRRMLALAVAGALGVEILSNT